jgi:hypothetical protein
MAAADCATGSPTRTTSINQFHKASPRRVRPAASTSRCGRGRGARTVAGSPESAGDCRRRRPRSCPRRRAPGAAWAVVVAPSDGVTSGSPRTRSQRSRPDPEAAARGARSASTCPGANPTKGDDVTTPSRPSRRRARATRASTVTGPTTAFATSPSPRPTQERLRQRVDDSYGGKRRAGHNRVPVVLAEDPTTALVSGPAGSLFSEVIGSRLASTVVGFAAITARTPLGGRRWTTRNAALPGMVPWMRRRLGWRWRFRRCRSGQAALLAPVGWASGVGVGRGVSLGLRCLTATPRPVPRGGLGTRVSASQPPRARSREPRSRCT